MHEHRIRKMKIDVLSSMKLFNDFTEQDLDKLSDALQLVEILDADKIIVQEGDESDSMFVILAGEVIFEKNGKQVGKASKGQYFGELGLIKRCSRQATVKSGPQGSVELLKLRTDQFKRLMGKCISKLKEHILEYA